MFIFIFCHFYLVFYLLQLLRLAGGLLCFFPRRTRKWLDLPKDQGARRRTETWATPGQG